MANSHLVVGLDWYGPYNLENARRSAYEDYEGGLYLCSGKTKGQHHRGLQYVGKSNKALYTRLTENHHKLKLVTRDRKIWLGEIATGNVPGRKKHATPQSLQMAEWATAKFLNLPLNDKLRDNHPSRPVTVLNRWWKMDYDTPRLQRPHPDWPDLIDFLGPEYRARNVWFGRPGRLQTLSHTEFGS
jgi:hypothetical protein